MNPAIFVDGLTEKKVIQKICPEITKVGITLCNGKAVKIEAIAKRLATLIKLLSNRHYPIIILIDRENRTESCDHIKKELKRELLKLGVNAELLIGVCDRMIENWMLADSRNLKKHIKGSKLNTLSPSDGCHGKSTLKKYLPDYHETTDGVRILSSCDPNELMLNSPSFKDFAETIDKINCKWIKRD